MTTQLRLLAIATLTILTTVAAWCFPTIYGDTGLVQVPTADVVPYTFLNIAIDYTRPDNPQPGYPQRFNAFPSRLTYGVGSGSEIFFFDSFDTGGTNSKYNVIGGGMKFQAIKEDPYSMMPGWAIGARGYSMQMATLRNVVEGYTVLSRTLLFSGNLVDTGFALRLHIGGSYTNYSGEVSANRASYFTGISIKQAHGIILDVDYLPGQQTSSTGEILQSSTLSVAVRYPFNDNSSLELGSTKAFASSQSSLYAGFSVLYGNSELAAPSHDPVLE